MPGAIDNKQLSLEADEFAWLATQEDVESRLVLTRRNGDATKYEVHDGPFQEDFLASLPQTDWTLLVQDVEKHLPDFRAVLAAADFIPDWRFDDLMVSCAAPGGGVGPHRDNYDVFLCQGQGVREWRLGDRTDYVPDESSGDLSLLRPFADEQPRMASSGDVLYLPPGIPHWGIARDFCMTWSIGMRAPNVAELRAGAARILHKNDGESAVPSAADSEVFYEDPDLTIDEAQPGLISNAAVRRAQRLMRDVGISLDEKTVARILGCVATDPKAWLAPETLTSDEANQLMNSLQRDSELSVHGMARIAFCHVDGICQVFANGDSTEVSAAELDSFNRICRDRRVPVAQICARSESGLLHWLLTHGVIDLTEPGP